MAKPAPSPPPARIPSLSERDAEEIAASEYLFGRLQEFGISVELLTARVNERIPEHYQLPIDEIRLRLEHPRLLLKPPGRMPWELCAHQIWRAMYTSQLNAPYAIHTRLTFDYLFNIDYGPKDPQTELAHKVFRQFYDTALLFMPFHYLTFAQVGAEAVAKSREDNDLVPLEGDGATLVSDLFHDLAHAYRANPEDLRLYDEYLRSLRHWRPEMHKPEYKLVASPALAALESALEHRRYRSPLIPGYLWLEAARLEGLPGSLPAPPETKAATPVVSGAALADPDPPPAPQIATARPAQKNLPDGRRRKGRDDSNDTREIAPVPDAQSPEDRTGLLANAWEPGQAVLLATVSMPSRTSAILTRYKDAARALVSAYRRLPEMDLVAAEVMYHFGIASDETMASIAGRLNISITVAEEAFGRATNFMLAALEPARISITHNAQMFDALRIYEIPTIQSMINSHLDGMDDTAIGRNFTRNPWRADRVRAVRESAWERMAESLGYVSLGAGPG